MFSHKREIKNKTIRKENLFPNHKFILCLLEKKKVWNKQASLCELFELDFFSEESLSIPRSNC